MRDMAAGKSANVEQGEMGGRCLYIIDNLMNNNEKAPISSISRGDNCLSETGKM